jgi:hypothetical protein
LEDLTDDIEALETAISDQGSGRGRRRYLPYVFTEGVAILSSFLTSERAVPELPVAHIEVRPQLSYNPVRLKTPETG